MTLNGAHVLLLLAAVWVCFFIAHHRRRRAHGIAERDVRLSLHPRTGDVLVTAHRDSEEPHGN